MTVDITGLSGWIKLTSTAATPTLIGSVGGVAQATCQGEILSVASATSVILKPGHTCVTQASPADVKMDFSGGHFVPAVTTGGAGVEKAAEISVVGVNNTIVVAHLQENAQLSVGGCAFSVSKSGVAASLVNIALYGHTLGANDDFDCIPRNGKGVEPAGAIAPRYGEFATAGTPVYRRTDNPNNQNIYKAPVDTGSQITKNLVLTRGSAAAYLVDAKTADAHVFVQTAASEAFTTSALATEIGINEPFFVNGRGPMTALAAAAVAATSVTVANPATALGKYFPRAVAAINTNEIKWPVVHGIAADADAGVVAAPCSSSTA